MTISKPQTFEPDGRAIPFIDEGEGHLVVLLPGRGLSISTLGAVTSVLDEEGFRVLRIGARKPVEGTALTMHDLAQDAIDVLDHLGLGKVWIGGHSFGGAIARTVALDHAERVEGLVLLSVVGTQPLSDEAAAAVRTSFSDAAESDALDAMRVMAGPSVDPAFAWSVFSRARDVAVERMQTAALQATPTEEWAPLAPRIPVTIIQGTEDRITGPANGEQLRVSAPERASLTPIEGAGHLFVLTHPGEIGAAIEDYLGWD